MANTLITKNGSILLRGDSLTVVSVFGKSVCENLPPGGVYVRDKELVNIGGYHLNNVQWDFSLEPPIGFRVMRNGKMFDTIPIIRNSGIVKKKEIVDRNRSRSISHKIVEGSFIRSGYVRLDKDVCTLSDRTISIIYDTKSMFGSASARKIPVLGLRILISDWSYIVSHPERFGRWEIAKLNPGEWYVGDGEIKFDLIQLDG